MSTINKHDYDTGTHLCVYCGTSEKDARTCISRTAPREPFRSFMDDINTVYDRIQEVKKEFDTQGRVDASIAYEYKYGEYA